MSKRKDFGRRLKEAFDNEPNGRIAAKLGVAENTVGFYVRGRVPDAEMLIRISNATGRSVDWLLTGRERAPREVVVERLVTDPIINREELKRLVREIVREEMSPPFDLDAAIASGKGDAEIIEEWYRAEGQEPPQDFLGMLAKPAGPMTRREMLIEMKRVLDETVRQQPK